VSQLKQQGLLWHPANTTEVSRPGGNRTGGRRPTGYTGHAEPFQLTSPIQPEADLHIAVVQALRIFLLPPTMWCTYVAGHGKLTAEVAERQARIGVKPGWPDIFVVAPQGIFGIELKTIDGELSTTREVRTRRGGLRVVEGQAETFSRLEAAGMRIAVCRTVEEVLGALEGWGVPLRPH
jgi:hypothetical protein